MTVVVDDRLAERRREVRSVRRRRRLRRTGFVLALLLLAAVGLAVESSDLVALQEVAVTGTERLDPDDVRAAAALELGTSMLRLRLGAAERRVEELPLVLEADARRADPLTVTIAVTERQPALVVVAGRAAVLLDREGQVVDHGHRDDLPLIEFGGRLPEVGGSIRDEPALAAAFRVAQGLPGPLRTEVARYLADGEEGVDVVLERGTRVRFGSPERLDEKARALGAVLEDVGATAVSLIDVRAPSAPIVRR